MEIVVFPDALIPGSIGPNFDSLALHFAIYKLSLVHGVVGPCHHTLAGDSIVFELTLINLRSFSKIILASTMEKSINEISFIAIFIKFKLSFTSFLSFDELSLISCAIEVPGLDTVPMIFIVLDLPLVDGTFLINEYAEAICLSINPLSLDDITVAVRQSSFAIELHICKLALVNAAVSKLNGTESFILVDLITHHKNCIFWKTHFPLTLVKVALSHIYPVVVPSSITALTIIVEKPRKIFIRKKRLIRKLYFVVFKSRISQIGNSLNIYKLQESPSCKCSLSPLFEILCNM